jgi:hypothetical protein
MLKSAIGPGSAVVWLQQLEMLPREREVLAGVPFGFPVRALGWGKKAARRERQRDQRNRGREVEDMRTEPTPAKRSRRISRLMQQPSSPGARGDRQRAVRRAQCN